MCPSYAGSFCKFVCEIGRNLRLPSFFRSKYLPEPVCSPGALSPFSVFRPRPDALKGPGAFRLRGAKGAESVFRRGSGSASPGAAAGRRGKPQKRSVPANRLSPWTRQGPEPLGSGPCRRFSVQILPDVLGNVSVKVLPFPTSLFSSTDAPRYAAPCLTMDSPSPVPPAEWLLSIR